MRCDPRQTREEVSEALLADARTTWGEEWLGELRAAVETTAAAIWLVGQELLETTDVEP